MTQKPIRIELPIPFAVGPVNAYLLLGAEPTLVDTGLKLDNCRAALEQGLAENGLRVEDLRKIVITHAHVDHAGLAAELAERSGAEVWVSDIAYEWIARLPELWGERMQLMDTVAQRGGLPAETRQMQATYMGQVPSMWDAVPESKLHRFAIDGTIEMGDAEWQVIYAPGHTVTQTCFYQPEQKWLISADMLLHKAPTPVIDIGSDGERIRGLPQLVEMYHFFQKLEIETTFPGHGELITDHQTLIQNQLDRILMRKEEVYDLVKAGNQTVHAITEVMYAHYPPAARSAGFGMVIGYLDLLMEDGVVQREIDAEKWCFSPT